jgi:hypothetical protein
MCFLCGIKNNIGTCKCCNYVATAKQAEHVLPSWYNDNFNSAFFLPNAAYITKMWFLEKTCFGTTFKTNNTEAQVVEKRSRVGVAIGQDMWDRCKRRLIKSTSVERMRDLGRQYELPMPIVRIIRFRKCLDLLSLAGWANVQFLENEQILRRMTASHLRLIVGFKEWNDFKSQLYPLIEPLVDLSATENLIWITNRQQGKTTNLGKFNAALVMLSPIGGNLKFVYSTGLDRAQELVRESKRYIKWIQGNEDDIQDKFANIGMAVPKITTDNEKLFVTECTIQPGILNTLKARPMNPDGCRGDNPKAADVDEVGYITMAFWFIFLYPLLQVGGRVFTMATTPPPIGTFFDDFARAIIKRNLENDFFFTLINHSMTCAKCLEKDVAQKCSHKLYLIPKWKQVSRVVALLKNVPKKQLKAVEAEMFGIMGQDDPKYFPRKLVDQIFLKNPTDVAPNIGKNPVVYFSVDPASHSISCMGVCAFIYTTEGQVAILGLAEISIFRCEMAQINMCIKRFTSKVLQHPCLRRYQKQKILIIPIVECNNNETVSREIVLTIKNTARGEGYAYRMPFTKRNFATGISEDLGVWASEESKRGGIKLLYFMMVENRIVLAEPMITIGDIHKKDSRTPSGMDMRELLRDELVSFHDNGKTVTGKTSDTNDDMAISVIQGLEWAQMIRAISSIESMMLFTN